MGIGISGVLKPNGEFLECEYGQHSFLIRNVIPRIEQEFCLYFSSPKGSKLGVINGSAVGYEDWKNGITKKQFDWIKEHEHGFDEDQIQFGINMILEGEVDIIER